MGQRIRAETIEVPAFDVDRYMVTNGEFLISSPPVGYAEPSFWTDLGLGVARIEKGLNTPCSGRGSMVVGAIGRCSSELPLPLDWPVYVSHAEASAFAKWAGKRLPSEAEWHRAAYADLDGSERQFPWGNARSQKANLEILIFADGMLLRWEVFRKAKCLWSVRPDWKWLGVDQHLFRTVQRLQRFPLLSGIFGRLLR